MREQNLKVLIRDAVRELKRQHREVVARGKEQRARGLTYSPEDVQRLRELNAMINPLARMLEALKHSSGPTSDDVDKLIETLANGIERLKSLEEELSDDEE